MVGIEHYQAVSILRDSGNDITMVVTRSRDVQATLPSEFKVKTLNSSYLSRMLSMHGFRTFCEVFESNLRCYVAVLKVLSAESSALSPVQGLTSNQVTTKQCQFNEVYLRLQFINHYFDYQSGTATVTIFLHHA